MTENRFSSKLSQWRKYQMFSVGFKPWYPSIQIWRLQPLHHSVLKAILDWICMIYHLSQWIMIKLSLCSISVGGEEIRPPRSNLDLSNHHDAHNLDKHVQFKVGVTLLNHEAWNMWFFVWRELFDRPLFGSYYAICTHRWTTLTLQDMLVIPSSDVLTVIPERQSFTLCQRTRQVVDNLHILLSSFRTLVPAKTTDVRMRRSLPGLHFWPFIPW